MDPWFHGEEIVRFIESNKGQALMMLLPRDSGKSGTITVPMPAYWLAQDPFTSALVCNASEKKASQMVRASAAIITNNERFRLTFPYLIPSMKWGEDGYFIDTTRVKRGDGSVERIDAGIGSIGVRGNITGAHISGGMILDDCINERISRYPNQLEAVESFVKESFTCLSVDKPLFVNGTRWRYNDFYGKILDGEILGPRGKFKILKLGVTRKNDEGDEELIWPQRTYVDLAGRPQQAGYTWEYLNSQKANRGPLYAALYYNEPVTDDSRQFDVNRVKQKLYRKLPFELGPVSSVCVECESQGSALISMMSHMMREQKRSIRLEKIRSNKVNKEERIKAWLQPIISEFRLNVREDLFHSERNIGEEIRNFPRGHDDCIDALAYAAQIAKDTPQSDPPLITIVCDPAFTENAHSDYTAIVAVTFYRDELWLLDCVRFQTDRADAIIRMIFSMYDRFNHGSLNKTKKARPQGFSTDRLLRAQTPQGGWVSGGFDVDLDAYMHEKGEN